MASTGVGSPRTPWAGSGWRPLDVGRWTTPPRCGLERRHGRAASASGSPPPGPPPSGSGSACRRHARAGPRYRPSRRGPPGHPAISGICRWSGRWPPPAGTPASTPTGWPGPPGCPPTGPVDRHESARRRAFTGEAEPPVAALMVFDPNPVATVPDQRPAASGLPRADLFTVVWSDAPTEHLRPRRRGPTGRHAARTPRPAHLLRSPAYTTLNAAGARPAGAGAAQGTEIFRRIAAALGLGTMSRLRRQRRGVGPAGLLDGTGISYEELTRRRAYYTGHPGWRWVTAPSRGAGPRPRRAGPVARPAADRAGRRPVLVGWPRRSEVGDA